MLLDVLRRLALEGFALKREERARLSHGEDTVRDKCLYLLGEPQEADAVRNRRAAACHAACQFLLREAELRQQLFIGTRLLDGVQVLALDVLNESHLRHLCIRCRTHDHGNGRAPRKTRRTEATLTRNELILSVADSAHGERLEDAVARDGLAQLLQCCLIKLAARLKAVRRNHFDRDFGRVLGHGRYCGGCFLRSHRCVRLWSTRKDIFPKPECAEPTSEAALFSFLHAS